MAGRRDDRYDYRAEHHLDADEVVYQAGVRKKRKILIILISALLVAVLITAAVILITGFVKYRDFEVESTLEMTNVDESIKIYDYHEGYIKCTGEGITYFDKKNVIWTENFNMAQPMIDVCEDYIAAADMKATEVYLYGPGGYLTTISLTRVATAIQVSKYGSVTIVTVEGSSNYIQAFDKEGNELVTIKTVFGSSGYVSDIALSDDGAKLAATFIGIKDSKVLSRVVFYDLSKNSAAGEDVIVGTFDQYENTVLTNARFMEGEKVTVVGDNSFSIYSVSDTPKLEYEELDVSWQIQTLFFSNKYIGFISEDAAAEEVYTIKVYDTSGKQVLDQGFNFAYNHADFAGNSVLLYSDYDCDIYNFFGTHKFSYSFEDRIMSFKSTGGDMNFIYMKGNATEFIRLK